MSGEGFMPGVWCGVMFGAAWALLAMSLCFSRAKADPIIDEERLAALRKEDGNAPLEGLKRDRQKCR